MTIVTAIESLETGLLIWVDKHRYHRAFQIFIPVLRRPCRWALCLVTVGLLIWTVAGIVSDCGASSQHLAEGSRLVSTGMLSALETVQ